MMDESSDNSAENNDSELLKRAQKCIRRSQRHFAERRQEMRRNYDYRAGQQWDESDRQKLADEGRPCITFNYTSRVINAILGFELQNRQEVRFIPRETSDAPVNELLSEAAQWVRDNCDAEDEESDAYADTITGGVGWTETRLDTESDPEGQIVISRLDPFSVYPDPDSKKQNYADAKYVAYCQRFDRDTFKSTFGDVDIEPGTFSLSLNDEDGTVIDADPDNRYSGNNTSRLTSGGDYTVVQYQYYEREPVYSVLDVNGQVNELDEATYQKLESYIVLNQLQTIKSHQRKYYQLVFCGNTVLEHQELKCGHFTINAITGLRDHNRGYWLGVVDLLADPQQWTNKWLSQILYILNTNAKGGLIAEQGAFANPRKMEQDYADPSKIVWANPGGLDKIKDRSPPQYPEGFDRLMLFAQNSIADVSGVPKEFMGLTDRDQAIGLEALRKNSGVTSLAVFSNALRRYRKEQGRVLAEYIREYIADGRLVRIVGEQGAQYVPLLRDKLAVRYDVIVDDAPTSPNMKERTFYMLKDLLPLLLQAGIPIPPEVLDYAPLPEALAQKWKQMLAPPQPDPMAQQLQQLQMAQLQLEAEQLQLENQKLAADTQKVASDITLNYAKAQQATATGQDESAQAAQKMGLSNAEHELKIRQLAIEQARKYIEMQMNEQRKTQQMNMQMGLQAQRNQMMANRGTNGR